ncbi:MAG: hypothetical protein AB7P94_17335 [Steroidobacteraceae bacterium]
MSTSSTQVVTATGREQRQLLVLSNDSDETIYLAIGGTAEMNKGIRLGVGATFIFDKSFKEESLNSAVNAICASGSKVLCIHERYLDQL